MKQILTMLQKYQNALEAIINPILVCENHLNKVRRNHNILQIFKKKNCSLLKLFLNESFYILMKRPAWNK